MRTYFVSAPRRVRCLLFLLWLCGLVLLSSLPSLAAEQRARDETPLYPGDIVEPRLMELLPHDAATYADRYRYCLHWSTEPAYDEERADDIASGIEESCTGLEAARDSLRLKYPPGSSVGLTLRRVIADIDSFSDDFVWDDPHHKSAVLNHYYEQWARGAGRHVDELIAKRHDQWDTAGAATRNILKFMTTIQTQSLASLIKQIDRLRPEIAAELRAARVRWERETGEKVDSR